MADGVIKAWLELKPKIPIFFTIHGTGEDEAIAMVERAARHRAVRPDGRRREGRRRGGEGSARA